MYYDFDEIIDRENTNAVSTDAFHRPDGDPWQGDYVRMWIADMDFAVAPEIQAAIRERTERRIFGYTGLFDGGYCGALRAWCSSRYDWFFQPEELCTAPGVV